MLCLSFFNWQGQHVKSCKLYSCINRMKYGVWPISVTSFGPRQANFVLIAYASSEGSGEPAHPRSLARTSAARESRGTFRQKARSLAPLNGWACADQICHDGMLEDTNSLDGAHLTWEPHTNHLKYQNLSQY